MNSILSSANMLGGIADMNRNRSALQSGQGVLASQIEADAARGVNTKAKEEQYAQAEEGANNLLAQMGETSGDLTKKIAEDSEKIRAEEAAKDKAAEKAAENKAEEAARTEKLGETTPTGETRPATGTGEAAATPAVTVEISAMAQRAAAATPAPVPEIVVAQPVQVGEVVNVKA
jgi:hypothetical protein